MNHRHHERLRVELVNAGFLEPTAKFTPTKNWVALEELSERVQKKRIFRNCRKLHHIL